MIPVPIKDEFLRAVYFFVDDSNFYLLPFTIIVNIVHLVVLFNKNLRYNSTFVILIGISFADLVTASIDLGYYLDLLFISDYQDDCYGGDTLAQILYLVVVGWTIAQVTRRVAAYLALLMTFYRMLSVMFPINHFVNKLSNWSAGVWTVVVNFIIWTLFRIILNYDLSIRKLADDENCEHTPQNYTHYVVVKPNTTWQYFANGAANMIPIILYPILTVFLISELRRIKRKQRNMNQSNSNPNKNENTNSLIIFMTVAFFISEMPNAVFPLMRGAFLESQYLADMASTIFAVLSLLVTMNSASNVFICFFLSTQYRNVAKSLVCSEKKSSTVVTQETTHSTQTSTQLPIYNLLFSK